MIDNRAIIDAGRPVAPPMPGPPAGKVSRIAIGITHPGLADAIKNGVIYLIVQDLADANVKRWADVFIPMQILGEDKGKALEKGAAVTASAPLYGIKPGRCEVIGRTTVAGGDSDMLFLILDATGPSINREERDA